MGDAETIAVYDAKAADYEAMVERQKPDDALVVFLNEVKPGGRILDLGCGVGNASAYMRKKGFRVDAVDASTSMVSLANRKHDLGAVQQDFDELRAVKTYDGVWANFSLLHATREKFEDHLQQVRTALKADGFFHIGMKLGKGESRDRIGRFYTYYSFEELNSLLNDAGFRVLSHIMGEGGGLSGESTPWVTILSRLSGGNPDPD